MDGNIARTKRKSARSVAAFTGGVDGNSAFRSRAPNPSVSPPSRAAWIEIRQYVLRGCRDGVAAFTGGVDGNFNVPSRGFDKVVAAFTGGVDGNSIPVSTFINRVTSPPSRAAWIEISASFSLSQSTMVAAFTGGVDGNNPEDMRYYNGEVAAFTGGVDGNYNALDSVPINGVAAFTGGVDGNQSTAPGFSANGVAAFTGGVDGNSNTSLYSAIMTGRRLHGRRGLKSYDEIIAQFAKWSPPSRAAWIEISARSHNSCHASVAAFTGGVDGNSHAQGLH